MLKNGDKVGIAACSNAQQQSDRNQIEELVNTFTKMNLVPVLSNHIYGENSIFSGTGKERANDLMGFYRDESIKAIFDISGGDIANEILEFLDFEMIKNNPKPFWGYSDLTTVINALYKKTGGQSYLYQVKNLVWENKEKQISDFKNTVLCGQNDLHRIQWHFIKGASMKGVVIGGNIRCLLKLAGTPYMPDFKDKILFLESHGGGAAQMTAYLSQLKQLGVFQTISGLLLGTFTKMEEKNETPSMADLAVRIVDKPDLPIAKTWDIGHGSTSKCLIIGKEYVVERSEETHGICSGQSSNGQLPNNRTMAAKPVTFVNINESNRKQVTRFIKEHWFSTDVVIRGTVLDMTQVDGIIALDGTPQADTFTASNNQPQTDNIVGLLTYIISGDILEITSLNSECEGTGIGTALIHRVIQIAREQLCKKIVLITTNDNINAIRFYQKRGFDMAHFYRDALEVSRELKPSIPLTGDDGIPLKHEIEFEMVLSR